MIYLLPVLNALFGWVIISVLIYFLFRPRRRINLLVIDVQGLVPKNLATWGSQLGIYAAENLVNISRMKESLLRGERLDEINSMLESKVDDFLRNKLKEKIPVISMFITDGMIGKMKEVLLSELGQLVPGAIEQIAAGVEKDFDVKKLIEAKANSLDAQQMEMLFMKEAGRGILFLKIFVALLGFILGWLELLLLKL